MSDKRNSVGVENPPPELHETNSHSIAKPALETVTGDAALNFLENHEAIAYTREEEKVIIRKIDRVLMPLVSPKTPASFEEITDDYSRCSSHTRFSKWLQTCQNCPTS